MSVQQNRELALIRAELRMRLMARRYDGTSEILERLEQAAGRDPQRSSALLNEYERWRTRFELLGT